MLFRLIVIFLIIVGISTIMTVYKSYKQVKNEMNKPRPSNDFSKNPNNKQDIEVDYTVKNKE